MARLTLEQIKEKGKILYDNRYDYSNVGYINNSTKVEITCKKHNHTLKYIWDKDNKEHYYHPDIVIPLENKIIEVKSSYTVNDERLPSKIKGCIKEGWDIEVWIMNVDGSIGEIRNGC